MNQNSKLLNDHERKKTDLMFTYAYSQYA
jgi:hypothetical protein